MIFIVSSGSRKARLEAIFNFTQISCHYWHNRQVKAGRWGCTPERFLP